MRLIAIALGLCISLAPLQAAARTTHPANTHLVKVKKNKVNGRKAPKRKIKQQRRVN
jgi:hypothetical protein